MTLWCAWSQRAKCQRLRPAEILWLRRLLPLLPVVNGVYLLLRLGTFRFALETIQKRPISPWEVLVQVWLHKSGKSSLDLGEIVLAWKGEVSYVAIWGFVMMIPPIVVAMRALRELEIRVNEISDNECSRKVPDSHSEVAN